jgi:hypothetical protein
MVVGGRWEAGCRESYQRPYRDRANARMGSVALE